MLFDYKKRLGSSGNMFGNHLERVEPTYTQRAPKPTGCLVVLQTAGFDVLLRYLPSQRTVV